MLNLIIVGSIALDDIETPFGYKKSVLGGSSIYASLAASFFSPSGIVGIVGKDMPARKLDILRERKVDTAGLAKGDKTFHWSGYYEYDMNEAKTRETKLNSFANFDPILPDSYKKAKFVFLANIGPDLQLSVLDQVPKDAFVVIDTMNYWIEKERTKLLQVIKKANLAVLNDGEARLLFDTPNLIKCGAQLLDLGVEYAIIKKGEHGALLFSPDGFFSAPGYPIENVVDPTGAGDSFAGGLIGYLAQEGSVTESAMRRAVISGSAVASFCAEDFGTNYIKKIKLNNVKERYETFRKIREF